MTSPLSEATSDDPRATPHVGARDPRAIRILAKSIYRELRQTGLEDEDVMSLAVNAGLRP